MMNDEVSTQSTKRRQLWPRIAGLGLVLGLLTAACGTESTTDLSSAPVAELSELADEALAPTAAVPAAATEQTTASEPAAVPTAVPVATAIPQPAAPADTGPQETAAEETAPLETSPEQAEQPVATPVPAQDTTTTATPAPTAEPATTMQPASPTGSWPSWYQPPAAVQVLNVRDGSSGERRITTDLVGLDYETVCEDWRAQAAAVGLSPTSTKQCDDPTTRWTVVESATGADAEIQEVSGLSYDVLFVFDSASLSIGAASAPAAPAPTQTESADTQAPAEPAEAEETGLLPGWFNPTVNGTELAHAVENGTYEIAAIGTIASNQTYTALCEEFVVQASAAGWIRQPGDECGEDSFDGATFVDPATGFEVRVRNYRGAEIVYSFDVAASLTPAQITDIAFDPELRLLPIGFTLVTGEQVIGLAESIDSTGAYNTAIQVAGAAGFERRCELLLDQANGAQIVLGSCTSELGLITINTGVNTTVILEDDLYTFVTR